MLQTQLPLVFIILTQHSNFSSTAHQEMLLITPLAPRRNHLSPTHIRNILQEHDEEPFSTIKRVNVNNIPT